MEALLQQLSDWLKGMLVDGIMNNLSGMFDAVNQQVADVATQVGNSPANFSPAVFGLVRNISETVIIPIAGMFLTFIACYELIQLIIEHNNLANFETWIFFKWIFKTFVAVMLITNTFNIVMAVFDVAQHVVNASAGLISGSTAVDASTLDSIRDTLEAMEVGPLLGLFLQSFIVQVCSSILSVAIFFTFNASALEGKAVVAFEDLYRDKKLIATHADLRDEDQTIRYPKIGTELRDSGSGTHYTTAVDDAVLIDTVFYSNLIAGRKYNVVGVLMDKETGAQVQADGEAVRAAAEFTPDGPDGTVELSFRISGPALAGKTVVAFEVLYDDGKEVAAHEDMDDEAQTVYSPGIRTEFINNESNSHYAEAENPRNFTDTVYYTNLMPGRSYTVSGTLVDKATGKNLIIGGSEVTAEKTFTPEEKDGIVEISFELDCRELTGKSVVAYEFLYRDGIMIAGHADINDEDQTVTIGKKPTPTPTVTPIPPTKVPGRPSTPSTPGTTTRSAPVRTGDTTNILLPVILLGVSAAVRELEKTGYLTRHQERLENGKIGRIEYSIFERPQIPAEDDGGAIQYGDGATDRDIARPEACEEMEGTEDEPDAGFDLVPEEQSAVNGAGAETPVESKHAESLNECRTSEDKPLTGKPVTGKPLTEKPLTEKPFTEKPFTGKPFTEKPLTEKPFTEKPFTEKPFTEKPLTGKPSTENPTEININKSNTDGSNTKGIKDGGIKGGQQFRRYGTFGNVFLTDDEFDRLRHEFPSDYMRRIERLSEYMATTGKRYDNHLSTIERWSRWDSDKSLQSQPPVRSYSHERYRYREGESL